MPKPHCWSIRLLSYDPCLHVGLWVVCLPGCVSAGLGLSVPSFCVTGFRNRPRRGPGLSTAQHLPRAFLYAKRFAFPFIGSHSEHWCKVKNHYSGFNAKGETEIGTSNVPHKPVLVKMGALKTPVLLAYFRFISLNRTQHRNRRHWPLSNTSYLDSHGEVQYLKGESGGLPSLLNSAPSVQTASEGTLWRAAWPQVQGL